MTFSREYLAQLPPATHERNPRSNEPERPPQAIGREPDAPRLGHGYTVPSSSELVVVTVAETEAFDVDGLYRRLRRALRHGVRASRLIRSSSDLIELLAPSDRFPGRSLHDRAISAEALIRQAVDQVGGAAGQALAVVLGLATGTHARKLEDRRAQAAAWLDVQPDTFRRDWHEAALLYDLAVEVYRIHRSSGDG